MKNLSLLLLFLLFLAKSSIAAIHCDADYKLPWYKKTTVGVNITSEQNESADGEYQINSIRYAFNNHRILHYTITPNLDFSLDNFNYNYGESKLALLHSYLTNKEMQEALHLTIDFSLSDVARVKIYDLSGDALTDKFGGITLTEVYNANNNLLGRFFNALIINTCR